MYSYFKICLEVKAGICFAPVLMLGQQEIVKISVLFIKKYLSYHCMVCNYHAKAMYSNSSIFKNMESGSTTFKMVETNFLSFICSKNNLCES